jgi:hypothetical protein
VTISRSLFAHRTKHSNLTSTSFSCSWPSTDTPPAAREKRATPTGSMCSQRAAITRRICPWGNTTRRRCDASRSGRGPPVRRLDSRSRHRDSRRARRSSRGQASGSQPWSSLRNRRSPIRATRRRGLHVPHIRLARTSRAQAAEGCKAPPKTPVPQGQLSATGRGAVPPRSGPDRCCRCADRSCSTPSLRVAQV